VTTAVAPVRVKICGVRSTEVALAAVDAGADMLGFNFAPVSRRRVDLRVARAAIDAVRVQRATGAARAMGLPQGRAERSEASVPPARGRSADDLVLRFATVGIFVNQPLPEVERVAAEAALDYIQLSGDESPDYCLDVAARCGRPVIKAVRLTGLGATSDLEAYAAEGVAAVLLADAAVPGSWGGSGTTWDWGAAGALAARRRLLLAGGLTPANVLEALAAVRPWGVDVASGVETNGVTDPAKVRAFVKRAKQSQEEITDGR
jgi:phosphoribosylanthranilate isomerase